jgi:hypothetical protein
LGPGSLFSKIGLGLGLELILNKQKSQQKIIEILFSKKPFTYRFGSNKIKLDLAVEKISMVRLFL